MRITEEKLSELKEILSSDTRVLAQIGNLWIKNQRTYGGNNELW